MGPFASLVQLKEESEAETQRSSEHHARCRRGPPAAGGGLDCAGPVGPHEVAPAGGFLLHTHLEEGAAASLGDAVCLLRVHVHPRRSYVGRDKTRYGQCTGTAAHAPWNFALRACRLSSMHI